MSQGKPSVFLLQSLYRGDVIEQWVCLNRAEAMLTIPNDYVLDEDYIEGHWVQPDYPDYTITLEKVEIRSPKGEGDK